MNASFLHHGIECLIKWAGLEMRPHNQESEHTFIGIAKNNLIKPIAIKGGDPEKAINRAKIELKRAIDIHLSKIN